MMEVHILLIYISVPLALDHTLPHHAAYTPSVAARLTLRIHNRHPSPLPSSQALFQTRSILPHLFEIPKGHGSTNALSSDGWQLLEEKRGKTERTSEKEIKSERPARTS